MRATITQIEKYNQAANTFFGKYGYLPGDIPAPIAVQFGVSASVAARTWSGTAYGNGDGLLESLTYSTGMPVGGEISLFWMDLQATGLLQGALTYCHGSIGGEPCLIPADIGQGNVIYVFSGGWNGGGATWYPTNINYFGISSAFAYPGTLCTSNPGLTVAQAQAIDMKLDDGLPQSGRVLAAYVNYSSNGYGSDYGVPVWVNPGGRALNHVAPHTAIAITTAAMQGTSTTCYDNGNTLNATQQYSMEISNGAGVNCALSFRMQAGD